MAISYPLDMPANFNLTGATLNMTDAIAVSESPFTFEGQTQDWGGQRWTGQITLSDMDEVSAAQWKGFLASLKGRRGTFLAGDLGYSGKRGTATSGTITGAAGDETVTVAMTGTLLAGDMFQLGSGSDATLHIVNEDQTGSGDLEIWPAIRKARAAEPMELTDPKGLFRLASNNRGWGIRPGKYLSFAISIEEDV